MGFLAGYKTYIVSAIMVATGIAQLLGMPVPVGDPITLILEGLGLGAVRHGIALK